MLRRQGLTPNQLRDAYEAELQKPYEDQRLIELFGKPPYEFAGEVPERDYPNYTDFFPEYVDNQGRQYQRTDEPTRLFVRIPLTLSRQPADAAYEDFTDFPTPGDELNLTSLSEELHVRVSSVPYDRRRAVSNVFVDIITRVEFIPDFVDSEGRYFMRCVRDACFLQQSRAPRASHEYDGVAALYYVRLPSILQQERLQKIVKARATSARTAASVDTRRKRQSASSSSIASSLEQTVAHVYVEATKPYEIDPAMSSYIVDDGASRSGARQLNPSEKQRLKSKVLRFMQTRGGGGGGQLSLESSSFPVVGQSLNLYHLHTDRFYNLLVTGTQEQHHNCSSDASAGDGNWLTADQSSMMIEMTFAGTVTETSIFVDTRPAKKKKTTTQRKSKK